MNQDKVIQNLQGQQLKIRNCSKKNFLFSVIYTFIFTEQFDDVDTEDEVDLEKGR